VSERVDSPNDEQPTAATDWKSPDGLDLDPPPARTVRISRRASLALVALAVLLLGLFAYGGWKRRQRQVAALSDANVPKHVAPATAAAADIVNEVPQGNVPTTSLRAAAPPSTGLLEPPADAQPVPPSAAASSSPVIIRQSPPVQPVPDSTQQAHQPTPEEQRLQAAYEAEQRAMVAPTNLNGFGKMNAAIGSSASPNVPAIDPTSQPDQNPPLATRQDVHSSQSDDYLRSTRTAQFSPYEIKAGWEIPAVMEQALNSDLPGEVKALVTSNVYDTATGRYVLIPQGARLVGSYDSHLGYGQDGVQVIWNRVIFPDGSSLDLSGMLGQDAQGFSGFRDKVDRHYKRLVGFAVLSSMFAAASEIAQNRNRSVLTYPSASEVAASAVGQQVSDLGVQVTRKNLNVQPTVKIPVGYEFNVRVNRDIVFDSPYLPFS
jgi:type IV secretion system protein VirB10